MRRRRSSINVWPSLADLGTILIVVCVSLGVLTYSGRTGSAVESESTNRFEELEETVRRTTKELEQALAANDKLSESLREAEESVKELRRRKFVDKIGAEPCIPVRDESNTLSVPPLLQILASSSGSFLISVENWPQDMDLPNIEPRFETDRSEFQLIAHQWYERGQQRKIERNEETVASPCRFFVSLVNSGLGRVEFHDAEMLVTKYFLLANSTDVRQEHRRLAGGFP